MNKILQHETEGVMLQAALHYERVSLYVCVSSVCAKVQALTRCSEPLRNKTEQRQCPRLHRRSALPVFFQSIFAESHSECGFPQTDDTNVS